jgi:hypothetical protein
LNRAAPKRTRHGWAAIALAICFGVGCNARTPATPSPTDTPSPPRSQVAAAEPATADATATPSPAIPTKAATATPETDPNLLLPDLQTLPPFNLRIERIPGFNRKLLRFSNSIINSGAGTLEVLGVFNPDTGNTAVTQNLYTIDDSLEAHAAGDFVFHPGHDHWHLEDCALYEVWSLALFGQLDRVVAVSGKISYCLRDDTRSAAPAAPRRPVYTDCEQERQGISPGWIDTYAYDTPGQMVNITALPDGLYALRSTVDPDNHLREADDTNNAAVVYIELNGTRVREIESRTELRRLLSPED